MGFLHGLVAKIKGYPTPDEGNFIEELQLDNSTVPDKDDRVTSNQRPPEPGKNQQPAKVEMIDPKSRPKPKPKPRTRRKK